MQPPQAPLAGVRVLDLSRLIPGPLATRILADLGAEIDKVEDPHQGDYLRAMPPMDEAGTSIAFGLLNRGKKSRVLDLKSPSDRDRLFEEIPQYDILLDPFRPGVLARLGLPYERLLEVNPRLIICALTGFGQDSPASQRAGHDLTYLARAGLLSIQGPGDGPPAVPAFQLADGSGALWSVIAILAALRERDHSGRGKVLDIAMVDGLWPFAVLSVARGLGQVEAPRGGEILTGGIAPYNTYLTSDGKVIALAALEPKFWSAFCKAVGIVCDMQALVPGPHQVALIASLRQLFLTHDAAHWRAFADRGDFCLEVATELRDLAQDPLMGSRLQVGDSSNPGLRLPVTDVLSQGLPPSALGVYPRASGGE